MRIETLIARYTAFAVVAIVANLLTQRLVLSVLDARYGLSVAIIAGTLVGLLAKYYLDKNWIFADLDSGLEKNGKKFALYSLMGIVTTLMFWGMETAFWSIWQTDTMREVGAMLGLTVGYVVKYHLDRRFVFSDQRSKSRDRKFS